MLESTQHIIQRKFFELAFLLRSFCRYVCNSAMSVITHH